jgi:hypothetical protein
MQLAGAGSVPIFDNSMSQNIMKFQNVNAN